MVGSDKLRIVSYYVFTPSCTGLIPPIPKRQKSGWQPQYKKWLFSETVYFANRETWIL